MLKKTITYTDFNGNPVTEDHYFHLSKADLIEMEMSQEGGLYEHLQKVVKDNNGREIIAEFKNLLLSAYGKKTEDGKRFIKTQALRDEFASSEAYSTLFMEMVTNADAAAEFVNGVIPSGLDQDLKKVASGDYKPLEYVPPRVLTRAEVTAMDSDELKALLADGATILET